MREDRIYEARNNPSLLASKNMGFSEFSKSRFCWISKLVYKFSPPFTKDIRMSISISLAFYTFTPTECVTDLD